jgi:tetratricopeptide (TPR) repeat protein
MKSGGAIIVACIAVSGCAGTINLRNAETHMQAGYAAQRQGDWPGAQRQFGLAVMNADLGGAPPHAKGVVYYEYGRALGVTCHYENAEKFLLQSKDMIEQEGQSPYLPLYELGLLSDKQGNYLKAVTYFSQLIPLMEKEGLLERYPLGVADAYERYGTDLQAAGRSTEAETKRARAREIRSQHVDAKPFGTPTPYGAACSPAS